MPSRLSLPTRILLLAVMIVLAGRAVSATPIALNTPSGLGPGDSFRFLFVTAGTRNATSSDINDYNTFVQTQAGNATYNGVPVNWKAIGSTSTVNARDNVGGFGTTIGVYTPSGTKLADSLTTSINGLWSGTLLSTPSERIDGTIVAEFPWTGSSIAGTAFNFGSYLGDLFGVYAGDTSSTVNWITASNGNYYGIPRAMYGLSEALVVSSAVPEIDPAAVGTVLALVGGALGLLERRRLKMC